MSSVLNISPAKYEPKVVQFQNLEFWTESFGNKEDPALILIMGSGAQGILWPQHFCEQLANEGFFVIRYDHRDTGLSSTINYQKTPYTLLDMARDVIGIMDYYSIKQAHIAGASMGGVIAMLLAAHYPERVARLILIMTTVDLRPALDAFLGVQTKSTLSKPAETVLSITKKVMTSPQSLEERVSLFIDNARISSGGRVPIDEAVCRQLALQTFIRMRNPEGTYNHFRAAQASHELHRKASTEISVPTLIIHGDSDPIFPLDHAHAIQQAIPHSSLAIIPSLGHGISSAIFFTPIIEKIVEVKHAHA